MGLSSPASPDSISSRLGVTLAPGEIGDPSVIPVLRKAVEDSAGLNEKYGLEGFDLRETLQVAIAAAQRSRGR